MANLLSVVNITRMEEHQNRKSVNQLITWVDKMADGITERLEAYGHELERAQRFQEIQEQYMRWWNLVDAWKDRRQLYLNARRDLEAGSLSEILLPLRDLERLAGSENLPQGSAFLQPLEWYYSKVSVHLMSLDGDLVYVVDLPLVGHQELTAVELRSYPVPQVSRNVTLQVDVDTPIITDPLSGQTQDLDMDTCVGFSPLVCLPRPILRQAQVHVSCSTALVRGHGAPDQCTMKVDKRRTDLLFSHGLNDFVLVTWGTVVTEQCRTVHRATLAPGTYRLKWTGQCSLCTNDFCIPHTVLLHSELSVHRWVPFNISEPVLSNLSQYKLKGLITPSVLAEPKHINLRSLLTATEPPPLWSSESTSIIVDSVLAMFVVTGAVLVGVLLYRRFCRKARTPQVIKPTSDEQSTAAYSAKSEAVTLYPPLLGQIPTEVKISKGGEV